MARRRTDQEGARLQGAGQKGAGGEDERRPELRHWGMRPVGAAAGRVAAPIVAHGGGGVLVRLKAEWTAVAGIEFAAIAWPETLGRDGALKLRVDSGYALDLQHRAPLLIERINLFFGRMAVTRLVILQGRPPLAAPPRPAAAQPLTAAEVKSLDVRLAGIADPELRDALAGLGHLVLSRSRDGG